MRAIQFTQTGGPEVLIATDLPNPYPKAGEALIRLSAIGVNYIDTYHRTGLYPVPLPFVPGTEGAGVIEALGDGVTDLTIGQRVAWATQSGSYAEYAVVAADKLVPVPDGLTDQQAAAALLQGMTAQYLAYTTYPSRPGDTVLIHAGAGGVGLLLTQMARRRGARVITTVSTEEKAQLARENGADEVILYTQTDFAVCSESVSSKRITDVYAPNAGTLHPDAVGAAGTRRDGAQRDCLGRTEPAHPAALRAGRRGPGPPRSGKPGHHG